MKYNDLVQLYFGRSDALQSLWTLFVVVIGGLLAFSSLRQRPDALTTLLVTVLFCFFAFRNIGAIHDITVQRFAILRAIKQYPQPPADGVVEKQAREVFEGTLLPPDFKGVRNFHVASDLLTIAALWALERRRRRNA